jgi:hypothetical protein
LLTLFLCHANIKRFARFKFKQQSDSVTAQSVSESDRLTKLEDEVQKLVQATNLSRLGR